VYGICNVVGASIPRNTDSGTYIHVGPEIGVASTKAFTGQVTVLMLLALCVGQMRGTVDDATVERIVRELKNMPLYIKDVLGLADKIKNLSKIYTYARNFLYLGRGYNYPTALEGALKLKEISYIHAEGYPAAEMKINNINIQMIKFSLLGETILEWNDKDIEHYHARRMELMTS
jgi:glucosamine--fructose-6-phosphate aminotransferase (isomerizing)